MTKADFVRVIKEAGNFASLKAAEEALDGVALGFLEAAKRGEEVTLPGMCKFSVAEKPEHDARNPKTGETIHVPAKRVVKVKVLGKAKEEVNK
jgi:DNA-binding protein HU-beta